MTAPQAQQIETRLLFRIVIETDFGNGRIRIIDGTPWGKLVNVAVSGGTVSGPAVSGRVLNMGGDWGVQHKVETETGTLHVTELDCKLMIETDDSDPALIEMTYGGVSFETTDKQSYFRTTPRFRTADPRYEALNRTVAVAHGFHRDKAGPIYDVYAIL